MTAHVVSFQSTRGTPLLSLFRWISRFVSGICEGATLARRYRMLASKSDAELAEIGLKRAELPRIVVFGK